MASMYDQNEVGTGPESTTSRSIFNAIKEQLKGELGEHYDSIKSTMKDLKKFMNDLEQREIEVEQRENAIMAQQKVAPKKRRSKKDGSTKKRRKVTAHQSFMKQKWADMKDGKIQKLPFTEASKAFGNDWKVAKQDEAILAHFQALADEANATSGIVTDTGDDTDSGKEKKSRSHSPYQAFQKWLKTEEGVEALATACEEEPNNTRRQVVSQMWASVKADTDSEFYQSLKKTSDDINAERSSDDEVEATLPAVSDEEHEEIPKFAVEAKPFADEVVTAVTHMHIEEEEDSDDDATQEIRKEWSELTKAEQKAWCKEHRAAAREELGEDASAKKVTAHLKIMYERQ